MRMIRAVKIGLLVTFITASGIAVAQDDAPPPPQFSTQDQAGPQGEGPQDRGDRGFQGAQDNQGWRRLGLASNQRYGDPRYAQPGPPPAANVPPQLTIAPGTFLTVRVNQLLSSDHNQPGDAFSATLVNPIVVNGVVVADRGQSIQGRVSDAQKAGRISGTSRLGVELTDLTLVDGDQAPLHTSLVNRNGRTSEGRDAVGIGAATGIGAIIGAGAAGRHETGEGAAIGAGAGAAAGIIGVLLTRGHATYISPEQVLTFRVENPIVVSTERAPQAFRYVGPGDYQAEQPRPVGPRPRTRPYYGAGYPVYGPGWGPYYGYPYYYGPSIGIGFGGFYGGRYHGRRR
ncbi:MAG: hypothetical protein ABI833_03270 [Acidobacteriota bacterium]